MRVLYYTVPAYLDATLPFIRELSGLVELHVLLEVAPESWLSNLFDLSPRRLPSGIVPAQSVLQSQFPREVQKYWQGLASFNLAVYNCRRTIHPATWWASHRVGQFIRKLQPSVLHLDDPSLRLAWALPTLKQVPTVLSIHDPEPHSGEHNWRTTLAKWLTFGRAERYVLHSHAFRESFCQQHRIPPEAVDVIPLGAYDVYRQWLRTPMPEESGVGPTILFFGRLSPYKGLEVLYDAATQIAESIPGVQFVVAGRPIRSYSPPRPSQLPNGARIKLIDRYVPNEELARLFQQAQIVVCPYTDATQSGVVLTAYAFDRPVVATAVGGLPEYVKDGETGLLVPPRDARALSHAVVSLLTNRELHRRLQGGIQGVVAGPLSWRTIAQQTGDLYHAVLARRRLDRGAPWVQRTAHSPRKVDDYSPAHSNDHSG